MQAESFVKFSNSKKDNITVCFQIGFQPSDRFVPQNLHGLLGTIAFGQTMRPSCHAWRIVLLVLLNW